MSKPGERQQRIQDLESLGRIFQISAGGLAIVLLVLVFFSQWGLSGTAKAGAVLTLVAWMVNFFIPSRTTAPPAAFYAAAAVLLFLGLPYRHFSQYGLSVWFQFTAAILDTFALAISFIVAYEARRQGAKP